jgi:hypothetical protein
VEVVGEEWRIDVEFQAATEGGDHLTGEATVTLPLRPAPPG